MFPTSKLSKAEILRAFLNAGGPGSGHWGHAGRPGERGGSAPGEGEGKKANEPRAERGLVPTDAELTRAFSDHVMIQDAILEGIPDEDNLEETGALLKASVEKDLQKRIASLPPEQREQYEYFVQNNAELQRLVNGHGWSPERAIIAQWANHSNDHNPLSLVMQKAAVKEFGLTGISYDHIARQIDETAGAYPSLTQSMYDAKQLAGARVFLRAMYDQTQEFFQKMGIKEVTAFRGVAAKLTNPVSLRKYEIAVGRETIQTQPLSSWSTYIDTAQDFANDGVPEGRHAVMLAATIPVERIIACPKTGYGCFAESEMVVLGGTDEMLAMYATSGWTVHQVPARDAIAYLKTARREKTTFGGEYE